MGAGRRAGEPAANGGRGPTGRAQVLGWLLPALFLLACLAAWQVGVEALHVKTYLLPAPTAIAARLLGSWHSIWPDVVATVDETLVGFVLGAVVGFGLAVAIAYSRVLERTLYPLIVASQAVPKIAVAPLFVLWFGFGIWPKVVVTLLLVFFPVVVTAAEGLMSVDRNLIDLLRSVNANERQIFVKVRFPHALPQVMAGLKIGVTLAVVGAVVGEWVGANRGLGYLIIFANSQMDTTLGFASLAVLVALGIVLFVILDVLGRWLTPWQRVRTYDPGM